MARVLVEQCKNCQGFMGVYDNEWGHFGWYSPIGRLPTYMMGCVMAQYVLVEVCVPHTCSHTRGGACMAGPPRLHTMAHSAVYACTRCMAPYTCVCVCVQGAPGSFVKRAERFFERYGHWVVDGEFLLFCRATMRLSPL